MGFGLHSAVLVGVRITALAADGSILRVTARTSISPDDAPQDVQKCAQDESSDDVSHHQPPHRNDYRFHNCKRISCGQDSISGTSNGDAWSSSTNANCSIRCPDWQRNMKRPRRSCHARSAPRAARGDHCNAQLVTSISGCSVLVVGASGGLGSVMSRHLHDEGAKLTLLGRSEARLAEWDGRATIVTGDLRDAETAGRTVEAAIAAHGRIDGLVIASGVVAFGMLADLTDETLDDLFATNVIAPIRLIRAALAHLEESHRGGNSPFVVNFSAVVAEQPTAGMAAYSASKAALTAFDAAAARELRRSGIRLIDVRPPHTETGLAERPIAGTAPRLGAGLAPEAVAERVIAALTNDERDLPSSAFTS